jgi:hypothetical protein
MAEEIEGLILKSGKADPDSCPLSKTGKDGLSKRIKWVAEDKEHDAHVTFAESPFGSKAFTVRKGGEAHSGDIRPEAKEDTYHYDAKSEEKEVAADPEVIIRN